LSCRPACGPAGPLTSTRTSSCLLPAGRRTSAPCRLCTAGLAGVSAARLPRRHDRFLGLSALLALILGVLVFVLVLVRVLLGLSALLALILGVLVFVLVLVRV